MKKLCCLFLTVLLLMSCTACADWDELVEDPLQELSQYYQSENSDPNESQIATFSLPYCETETLDSVTCRDGYQQVVGRLLYESLYELDETFTPQAVLAERYSYDPVDLTYTIQLRSGVCFSDGSPLTTADVVDTLHRAAESERYGSRFSKVSWLSGYGDNCIMIAMEEPDGGLPSLLDIPIVKSDTATQNIPLGTGPYAVAQEENGSRYLTPNPYWWQGKRLPLSRIDLLPCKTADAANYAFSAQNVQLLCFDFVGANTASASVSGACTDAPGTVMLYLGFNPNNELLVKGSVRRAISAAIDRETLVNSYLLGHGTAAQFPLPPQSALYPTDLETPYSREVADSAMAKAGLIDTEADTALTLLVNEESPFKVHIADHIAEVLSRYSLAVTVQALPWEAYLDALWQGEFDLYLAETKLCPDWDLTALIGTDGVLNYGAFWEETTDLRLQEFLEAQGTQRTEVMLKLCREFQQLQPIAPLCFKAVSVLVTSNVVDRITPTADDPFYHLENWTVHLADS